MIMTLDANKYRINVPSIKLMLADKSPQERYEFIGNLAIATGVPIIIVCYYVGELYGFDIQLYAFIERLKKFYNVTEVLGVPT